MADEINPSDVSAFGASISDDVHGLLAVLGYTEQESDDWLLGFCTQKVENTIKNSCNVTTIPCGLYSAAVEMVVGEFLFAKKSSGQLQGFSVNLDAVAKQIQAGDTSVSFADASKTPEQRLDALMVYLMQRGASEFVRYRRVTW